MTEPLASTSEHACPTRAFTAPPSGVIDPDTRLPLAGSYAGPLPHVDLGLLERPLWYRLAHEKAWYYVAIASPEVFVGVAILRFGYVASTFAFLFERGPEAGPTGHFLADQSLLAPPFAAKYAGDGGIRLSWMKDLARFERAPGADAFDLEVELKDFRVGARISAALTPSPVSAVAALGDGLVQTTEKRALLAVSGSAEIAGRRFSLDKALAGFDRSHGYLARHTRWRWAYALGHTDAGVPIGFNLVDGFVGEPECAVWVGDDVFPVGMARFVYDANRPLAPWHLRSTCGAVDLTFDPGDIHAEHQDLGLVRTRFIQPVGGYTGAIRVGGKTHKLTRVLGVVEDQDALW